MSNEGEDFVSEPNVNTQGVRIEPTFDPLFLETGISLVPFQESMGIPAKEVLRESDQSAKPFDAHTLRSKLSSYDLKLLREHCEIPPIVKLRLPDEDESANMTTIDEIGVYWDMFINGFRVPLHPFFVKVLNDDGLAPGQLSPHAWHFMSFFIYQCNMSSRVQGDPPLFNAQGVLGEIIPDELASVHGIEVEDEEMRNLDFGALISGSQPKVTQMQSEDVVLGLASTDKSKEIAKRRKVSNRAGSRATSSSVQPDAPHRPAWGISVEESVFKSPHTVWDWSRHAIIPMDHKTLSAYGIADTANGMIQLMSQAMVQVQIGAEKLIAADKVLDEQKKKVMIENNFRREAEKKVGELSKKKSKAFTDQRYRDSKRALVHGYHECKNDILKDHPDFDLSIYEHKFAREIAAEDILRAEEAERRRAASSRALTSPSISCSLGASGSALGAVSRQQSSVVEGQTHELGMPESAVE
ncbi:hypothetical protein RJ639_034561 [Escallonia herrerae]|uniref:Transposase (putative) gypsy type domain-containing protein n=1 Tax=Escallonia herrerae TaxID=1293975 RepID=A0AA88WUB0_9ASTE|nr:hypothetical protein RJ639_034561 [Escallonia herrerae]